MGAKDDPVGLQRSVNQIQSVINQLVEEDGIPPNKIVIGGFSQGGAVALLTCYHPTIGSRTTERRPFAGCVGLSAWLTVPDQVVAAAVAAAAATTDTTQQLQQTPLFWGHGTYDDKVLFPHQAFGVEKLKQIGVDVTAREYPMRHSSHPTEMEDFASFVDRVIFGGEGDDDAATSTSTAPAESEPRQEASIKSDL